MTGDGWQSGLMDQGSWVEMQRDWARTVIVGRARLGGCPVGKRWSSVSALAGIADPQPGLFVTESVIACIDLRDACCERSTVLSWMLSKPVSKQHGDQARG